MSLNDSSKSSNFKPKNNQQRMPLKSSKKKNQYDKIAFVGFRGVGKSVIAKELGSILKLPVFSSDTLIEKKIGMKVVDFVKKYNWASFRELEQEILFEFNQQDNGKYIFDTGGGIVEDQNESKSQHNIDLLKKHFFTIYLHASKDVIHRNLTADINERPALSSNPTNSSWHSHYDRRQRWYQEACKVVIDVTDGNINEVVQRVLQVCNL